MLSYIYFIPYNARLYCLETRLRTHDFAEIDLVMFCLIISRNGQ